MLMLSAYDDWLPSRREATGTLFGLSRAAIRLMPRIFTPASSHWSIENKAITRAMTVIL